MRQWPLCLCLTKQVSWHETMATVSVPNQAGLVTLMPETETTISNARLGLAWLMNKETKTFQGVWDQSTSDRLRVCFS
jgi:hypothetical protein